MDRMIIAAVIVGACLVVAAFLAGGRYALAQVSSGEGFSVYVVDRYLGEVRYCDRVFGCRPLVAGTPLGRTGS